MNKLLFGLLFLNTIAFASMTNDERDQVNQYFKLNKQAALEQGKVIDALQKEVDLHEKALKNLQAQILFLMNQRAPQPNDGFIPVPNDPPKK